ncbi:hypothetical protein KJA15_01800 [Patescibacteria group bacterium]|nr:hypothetical protein [Patescibacteria group bacterium]
MKRENNQILKIVKKPESIFLLLLVTLGLLPQLALADIILIPNDIWPQFHILILFLAIDIIFNFFVAAKFFSLFGENISAKRTSIYFIAILIITLSGIVINWFVGPIIGWRTGVFGRDYIINLIRRAVMSVGQIILFPLVFPLFKLSNKKTAFKVGLATVIIGFLVGCVIAVFYIGPGITPIMGL